MSKLRVNEITDLNDNLLWNVTEGVGGASVSTASGDQTLNEALQRRVIYVDTIADLQALDTSALVEGQVFEVSGYYEINDNGGGNFAWDSASTETVDGGTILKSDSTESGRFKRMYRCSPKAQWFGIVESLTDCSDRLQGFIDNFDTGDPGSAGDLVFPSGNFNFSGTIHFSRRVRLFGEYSIQSSAGSTTFSFPQDVNGITTSRSVSGGDDIVSSGMTIKGIKLQGGGGTVGHGFRPLSRFILKDMVISGFAEDGVHVFASSKGSDEENKGNCNHWYVENIKVSDNGRHGWFTEGADSNAGLAIKIDTRRNGEDGINDSSFLGNTYVGCHSVGNVRPYSSDGGYNSTVFVNCYSENGNWNIASRTVRIAGHLGGDGLVEGTGTSLGTQSLKLQADGGLVNIGAAQSINESGGVMLARSKGSGNAPFNISGDMILQSQNTNTSSVRILTGDSGLEAARFAGTGDIYMPRLPTSDPLLAGALWNDGGNLRISEG